MLGILFNKQMGHQFDLVLAPQLQALPATVVEAIKVMMSGAIRPVFWTALVVIACGVVIAQFLGRERLTTSLKGR